MSDPLPFGPWLKQRRRTLDLTQRALADQAHCSIVTIRKIESSDLTPSKQLAQQLAIALQVPDDDRAAFVTFARTRDATVGITSFAARSEPADRPIAPLRLYRVPAPLTTLVGREWEVNAGCDLFHRAGARLVTLSGPPGTGKTRLCLAIAAQLQNELAHGACFVPLAAINDPALVINAIAQALGVVETTNRSLLAETQVFLSDKHVLLVLDNFEQVIEAAPIVSQLLEAAPQVTAIVSSRETLRLYGEHEFPVPPLTVPSLEDRLPAGELKMYSAIELFVQRAQATQPRFGLTDDTALTLARICARLDGLPLAIEMAAARIKWIAPRMLLEQLNQHLSSLASSTRNRTPRQQTLRGAIDWSYDLLDDDERRVFEWCGVFVGGFSLEAMRALCEDVRAGLLLQALVEKNLLICAVDAEGAARYSMLEMIHEYACEKLIAHDRFDQARRAHAAYYLAVAEQAQRNIAGPKEKQALDRLELERHNLRAALSWASDQPGDASLLRLCGALGPYWVVRGHWTEGQHWTEQALKRTPATTPTSEQQQLRANVLHTAAQLVENQGHPEATHVLYEESLGLRRALNDRAGIAESLSGLGRIASNQGDFAQARTYFEASIELFRQIDNQASLANTLNNLGYVAHVQQGEAEARKLCEESLALRRALGDQRGIATTLNSLGVLAVTRGDYTVARRFYEESLALRRELGDRRGIGSTLNNLGIVASELGDYASAREFFEAGLAMDRELGDRRGAAITLINLGNVAYNLEDWEAARAGYAEGLTCFEELNDQRGAATALSSLGNAALAQGDTATAHQFYQRSLTRRRALGDQRGAIHSLAGMAGWLYASGPIERAVQLASAVTSLSAALHLHLDRPEQRILDRALTAIRTLLDEATFEAAWTQGQDMSIEEAIACALAS